MSSNMLLFLDFSINVINDRREKLRECRLNFTSAGNHVIIKVLKKKNISKTLLSYVSVYYDTAIVL